MNKTTIYLRGAAIAAALLPGTFATHALTEVSTGDFKFELNTDAKTATLTAAAATLTSADIPASFTHEGEEYTVTSIGKMAFYSSRGITEVSIPATIKNIGTFAFMGCSELTRVDITDLTAWCDIDMADGFSNPLYYGHDLYLDGHVLDNIIIPEGLTVIKESTFTGCGMRTVTLPASVTEINDLAFYGCPNLEEVELPSTLTAFGTSAFDSCTALKDIHLGNNVDTIGGWAFNGCSSLTSINIPASVTTIGEDAFNGCSNLGYVDIGSVESWCKISFSNANSNPLSIAHNLTMGGIPLTELMIPEGLTIINPATFQGCTTIEKATLPESLKEICDNAFLECTSLTTVEGGASVETIGRSAFECCISLRNISLSESLSSLGAYSFYGTELTEVSLPEGITQLQDGAFGECSLLKNIKIGNDMTTLGFGVFYLCTSLEEITLPSSTTSIGKSCFNGCSSLRVARLGGNLSKIANFAFADCNALTDIYAGTSVPPIASEGSFENYNATVWVPVEAVDAYKSASVWGLFKTIKPDESGITDAVSDEAVRIEGEHITIMPGIRVEIYDLAGLLIYSGYGPASITPGHGIYIINAAGRVRKVII